jgi:hypothetical protein
MSKASVVKFACGKYGVRHASGSFISRGYYTYGALDGTNIAKFCKMYKWEAKRLLKQIDTTVVEGL